MIRFYILFGFAFMFSLIHYQDQLNKYINTKYAYLSITAIVILSLLCIVEVARMYRLEQAEKRRTEAAERKLEQERHDLESGHTHDHDHNHDHNEEHPDHGHTHEHEHAHDSPFGHTHESPSRWKRTIGYLILSFPIFTGIFLPVQTLDSSFVKAKGFSFPSAEGTMSDKNPGQHQFLKPDSSVFYGKEGYETIKNKELADFLNLREIELNDQTYMKGMEVIYNFPGNFMGRKISFNGFAYKGEQVDGDHYFVFRFGFIHCAADSGVFGMLVDFPKGTDLENDDWVHVTGTLTSELYQPFKQKIPVLKVTSWKPIPAPEDPYVYRIY
ncbi:TIGR03943 family putative permease subunit [Cohnella herbarum]|uniref:TIGR03943 family protein n=1 Tax=Cohnella herbarum TaxID=2728023 RepID=A0A7Z2ZPY7_9BACL|nr:TIGR03943 family protein [Cohnella herbarum]QJD87664.1 TIGR03943 family protein [Cohnella herbarum]